VRWIAAGSSPAFARFTLAMAPRTAAMSASDSPPVSSSSSVSIWRHPRRAADEDHLVDVGGLELGVIEGLVDRPA
jgi:hypothetical protein